ncbi:MAG TPA: hypothetical protein VKT78_00210, partial [Fimbriimonadaceae bacterium]|nr:hypothetical protein [Fimbriimonadaceae bacterium]
MANEPLFFTDAKATKLSHNLDFKNVPAGAAGRYRFPFGGKLYPVVDVFKDGKPDALYIDFTGSGDFSRAQRFPWKLQVSESKHDKRPPGYSVVVAAPCPIGGTTPVTLDFARFFVQPRQPGWTRGSQIDGVTYDSSISYSPDYVLEGSAVLKGKSYHVVLSDPMAFGIFGAQTGTSDFPDPALLIDRDGDGIFQFPSEWFNARKPFNIAGTTYELVDWQGDGSHARIVESKHHVAEIPIPRLYRRGSILPAFTRTDEKGIPVHFPADFKGKVVLLILWDPTWPDDNGQVLDDVDAYRKHHGDRFDCLTVCSSYSGSPDMGRARQAAKKLGMTWNLVADGIGAPLLHRLGAEGASGYLVDGDTGKVLSRGWWSGNELEM